METVQTFSLPKTTRLGSLSRKTFTLPFGPDVTEFTSPGLQVFHEIVSGVLQERRFLSWELDSAQRKYAEAKQKLDKINWIPFIERIVPNVVKERKDDVVDAQESIEEIKKQIRECRAKLDLSFESRASEEKWNDIVRTVGELQYSNCIWNKLASAGWIEQQPDRLQIARLSE